MKILDTAITVSSSCEQCKRTFTNTYSASSVDEAMIEVVMEGCPMCNTGKTKEQAMREIFG